MHFCHLGDPLDVKMIALTCERKIESYVIKRYDFEGVIPVEIFTRESR